MKQVDEQLFKVLLVDDSPTTRMLLRQLDVWHPKSPFMVYGEVSDGKAALAFLEQSPCDLIISDIDMPNMGGIDLLKTVVDLYDDQIQVMLISSHKTFEWARLALVHGAFDYLVKPVSKTTLKESLDRLSERERLRNNADEDAFPKTASELYKRVHAMIKRQFWEYPDVNASNFAKVIIAEQMDIPSFEEKYKAISRAIYLIKMELLRPDVENELTRKAIKMILGKNGAPKTTVELAQLLFVNRSYLSHAFSKATGDTLCSYLFKVRMYQARMQLLTTNRSVMDISAKLGYEDQEYFSKMFKQAVGMLPSEYRKKYKWDEAKPRSYKIQKSIG